MEFTELESKMIARLRNHQRTWPKIRWALLLIGAGGLVIWGYFFFLIIGSLKAKWSNENLPVVILLYPWCLIMLHISCGLTVYALANWYGNAKEMLLLKLLEAKQK